MFTDDQCDGTYCGGGNGTNVNCSQRFYTHLNTPKTFNFKNLLYSGHFNGNDSLTCCVFKQEGGSETRITSLSNYPVAEDTTLKVYCDSRCQQ